MSSVTAVVLVTCVIIMYSITAHPTSIQGIHGSLTEKFRLFSGSNSTEHVVITVRMRKNVEDNLRSSQCPNGEVFTLACNKCGCNLETGVTLCSASLCVGWRCPRQQRHECYGQCPCNDHTYITSCEKKKCFTSGITHAQP